MPKGLQREPAGHRQLGTNQSGRQNVSASAHHARVLQAVIQAWPDLKDLPREKWWKLYIDKQHHKAAKQMTSQGQLKWTVGAALGLGLVGLATGGLGYFGGMLAASISGVVVGGLGGYSRGNSLYDPSLYYDYDESPGYKATMEKAFEQEILSPGSPLKSYSDYKKLHDLVTKGLPLKANELFRYGPSGSDVTTMDQSGKTITIGSTKFGIGGKGTPARDLYEETLGGKSLVANFIYRSQVQPDSICRFDPDDKLLVTNYTQHEGEQFVQEALNRYSTEQLKARTDDERLDAIVRLIRALHVIHAFRDANGRLHIMLMLNKLLAEQKLSPAYLKLNPEIFGGSYTVLELREEVKKGMKAFSRLVDKSRTNR